ncbi:MAG: HtaA domain-containing protein [Flaviflexus sp.]|nr:HtaA domain-containing protein [Flaviflexus sp.]
MRPRHNVMLQRVMAGLMVLLVAFLISPVGGASATGDDSADEEIVEIKDGYVIWGITYSWRKYAWEGQELSEGVEVTDPIGDETVGSYRWPISSGTYDPNTKTTVLNLDGKI